MGYLSKRLAKNETIACVVEQHWSIYSLPVVWTLALVGAPLLLLVALRDLAFVFAITNRRLIVRAGFLFPTRMDLKLSKVESIGVVQGRWGRLFDYGTVEVCTTSGKESFRRIGSPFEVRRILNETKFATIAR